MPSKRPCIIGRPGRSATRQNDSSKPSIGKCPLDQVVLADRCAAGGHENVCIELPCVAHGGRDVLDTVPNDAEFVHFGSIQARKRGEGKAIREDDFALVRRAARRHQFVPGTEYGHFRSLMHFEPGVVHGGRQHQVAVRQAAPLAQQVLIPRKIDALGAHVAPRGSLFLDCDAVGVSGGELLNHHGIAAGRHDAAGKNSRGFAWPDFSGKGMTRRHLTDDFKCDRGQRDITATDRVTIHSRQRGRWLRAQGDNVISENTSKRFIESDGFGRQRSGISQHVLQCFGNRHQRHRLGLRTPLTGFSATLEQQTNAFDPDAPFDCFDHVINRET